MSCFPAVRFCRALSHLIQCAHSTATHDEREAVSSCISRALSSRSGLRVHFTFLPRQKHFTFARQLRSLIARFYPRKNFTSVAARHAFAYRYCSAVQDESIWITQRGMAELFGCTSDNISLHLKNIYADGELSEISTTEDFSVVQSEGSRQVTRSVHTLFNAPQAATTFAKRRFAAV